jgi:hypothetical protein
MKRILRSALVLGVVSLAGVGVAQAQGAGRVSFHVGGGVVLPNGDFGDAFKTGFQALGGVSFGIGALPFDIRVDAIYGQNSAEDALNAALGVTDAKAKFFGGLAGAQFGFGGAASPVHPYLLAQVGVVNSKTTCSGCTSNSNSDFTFLGGAGLKFGKFFVEGKYMSIQSDPSSANMIVVSAGISFGGGM